MMPTTKRGWAVAALHELVNRMAAAPVVAYAGAHATADEWLDALVFGDWVQAVRDPTASDGLVDYCLACEDAPHGANCPVGMLEHLCEIGLDTPTPMAPNLGLASVFTARRDDDVAVSPV